jgi:hypothetical protein
LKHPNATLATYHLKTDETLENTSKTLAKTLKPHCKYTQHLDKTLATYV